MWPHSVKDQKMTLRWQHYTVISQWFLHYSKLLYIYTVLVLRFPACTVPQINYKGALFYLFIYVLLFYLAVLAVIFVVTLATQDVDKFSEQNRRDLEKSCNITCEWVPSEWEFKQLIKTSWYSTSNDSSLSINVLWREKLHVCKENKSFVKAF